METINNFRAGQEVLWPSSITMPQMNLEVTSPFRSYSSYENEEPRSNSSLPFIEANTKEVSVDHLKNDCIIPVFSKDNEITISHQNFIEAVYLAATEVFGGETIGEPNVRVSHVVKGRIPEAMHKPVSQLLESDKTIYYERMMFCIEIPSLFESVRGNKLNLTIGGVRAYNQENLYSRKTMERFKIFIGFKNMVCCNLCVSTDGYKADLRVMSMQELFRNAVELFRSYDMMRHLKEMSSFGDIGMTERQFAQFLGKSRMYQYLPNAQRKALPQMLITDTQIGLVAKAYYSDKDFGRCDDNIEIPMWNVYNMLTGANKSSYIDCFLDRSLNATDLSIGLSRAILGDDEYSWFIK